jgi:hypothetical protein
MDGNHGDDERFIATHGAKRHIGLDAHLDCPQGPTHRRSADGYGDCRRTFSAWSTGDEDRLLREAVRIGAASTRLAIIILS